MGDEGAPTAVADIAPAPAAPGAERKNSTTSTIHGSEPVQGIQSVPTETNSKRLLSRRPSSMDVHDYFIGPRDLDKHSKWPIFLRMHGSILPEMVLPLLFVAAWATCIRLISHFVRNIGVNQILLTVLGFVVGLGLSFRSSTAYERYNEGRKYWSQLMLASQNLARVIWIHGIERPDTSKDDLLAKMTGLNLIIAFSVALKHKLRFEPYTIYEDIEGLVGHLDTFAREATTPDSPVPSPPGFFKAVGEYLGVSFAESNPMKIVKKADKPLGNLPLEILNHIAASIDEMVEGGQLKVPMHQTIAYNNISAMNDVLTGTERILHTPLPVAYSIAIAQITWVYIIMLPFQLETSLKWLMIPASVIAAYIILGFLLIGREIENPFGHDVNDLPMDSYCLQIACDVDVIGSRKKPKINADIMRRNENKIMFPLSTLGYPAWSTRSENVIREEWKFKAGQLMMSKWRREHEETPSTPLKGKDHNHAEKVETSV